MGSSPRPALTHKLAAPVLSTLPDGRGFELDRVGGSPFHSPLPSSPSPTCFQALCPLLLLPSLAWSLQTWEETYIPPGYKISLETGLHSEQKTQAWSGFPAGVSDPIATGYEGTCGRVGEAT